MITIAEGHQFEQRRLDAITLSITHPEMTRQEIANHFNIAVRTVFKWLRWHRKAGAAGLKMKPHPTGQSRLSEKQLKDLEKRLLKGAKASGFDDNLWSCPRVARLIEEQYGVHYHTEYIGQLLHQLGWSVQRPQRQAIERDDEAVETWLKTTWASVKKKPFHEGRRSSSRMKVDF